MALSPGFWACILFVGTFAGCGGSTKLVDMDPLTFQARQTERGVVVDTLDPDLLFEEASTAYRAKRYLEAAEKYAVFLEVYPEHRYIRLAYFNAGLAWESLEEWKKAIGYFQAYLKGAEKERDRIDGLFRVGICQQGEGQWEASGETFDSLLARRLSILDLAEAWAYRGIAYHRAGRLAEAESAYERCLEVFRENANLKLFNKNAHVAQAQFEIGEIYRQLFDEIVLEMPLEKMERDLNDKTSFLIKAQRAYLRAIRMRNAHWSLAAGYRIGATYERFYDALLQADHPTEFDEDDVALYFDELRQQVRPIIERAIRVYETNLKMSDRSPGQGQEWAEKTRTHLRRLQELLKEDDARMERRRIVLEEEEKEEQGGNSE
jgi:tetratricopeptide (TPR) repeat protein